MYSCFTTDTTVFRTKIDHLNHPTYTNQRTIPVSKINVQFRYCKIAAKIIEKQSRLLK